MGNTGEPEPRFLISIIVYGNNLGLLHQGPHRDPDLVFIHELAVREISPPQTLLRIRMNSPSPNTVAALRVGKKAAYALLRRALQVPYITTCLYVWQ